LRETPEHENPAALPFTQSTALGGGGGGGGGGVGAALLLSLHALQNAVTLKIQRNLANAFMLLVLLWRYAVTAY
jgi:hypothetical protein